MLKYHNAVGCTYTSACAFAGQQPVVIDGVCMSCGFLSMIPLSLLQTHYHTSHPKLNYYAIVPKGPAEWWTEPHDRDQKFPSAK